MRYEAGREPRVSSGRELTRELSAVRTPGQRTRANNLVSLQRAVGNARTARVLAREQKTHREATPAPATKQSTTSTRIFRLTVVDDGKSGLAKETLDVALETLKEEMAAVAADSSNADVKAGVDIEVVSALESWKPKDLGKHSFIAFLIHDKDYAHWRDVAAHHVDLDERKKKEDEERIKRDLGSEGGVTLTVLHESGRSESIAFVSTLAAKAEEKVREAGPKSAGRLLGEVIVHEFGHSLGHHKHDPHGIMTAQRVYSSAGPYVPDHLSKESRKVIRERLEWLAEHFGSKKP